MKHGLSPVMDLEKRRELSLLLELERRCGEPSS